MLVAVAGASTNIYSMLLSDEIKTFSLLAPEKDFAIIL